jgi:hypothetical protein
VAHVRKEGTLGAIGRIRGIAGNLEFTGSGVYFKLEALGGTPETPYTQAVGAECETRDTQECNASEPPCSPNRWKHDYLKADTGFVPE